ncbi:hypothetical protein Sjap_012759 [Stephania japonica]|uniref:Uncharacterized protein n=1 Tax=Stephania japonica TaxID=461633 RepID=A0AAP0NX37_9MAGN
MLKEAALLAQRRTPKRSPQQLVLRPKRTPLQAQWPDERGTPLIILQLPSSSSSSSSIPYNYSFPNIHSSLVADTPSSITPHPLYYGLDHGRHHHHHRVHAYGSDYNHSWLSTYCNARSAQRTVEMRDRVFPAWLTEHHENRVAAEMRSRFNVVDQAAGDHHQPLIEFVRSGDDGGDDGDDQVAESLWWW